MRLYQVLFFLGVVSLSTQRITKHRQQQIIKDVKDLQRALRARGSPAAAPQPAPRGAGKKARKRDEIVRLLDELENEIRMRNYKNKHQLDDEDNNWEYQDKDERDEIEERDEDDERDEEERSPPETDADERDDYKVLQQYLRCNCGSARDRRGHLRCRRCNDLRSDDRSDDLQDALVPNKNRFKPKSRPQPKSQDVLNTLSKYGSRYKLNDDLEAIVIDVATVDKLAQKNKKARAKKQLRPNRLNQKYRTEQTRGRDKKQNSISSILKAIDRLTKANVERVSSPKKLFKLKSNAAPLSNKLDKYLPLFKASLRRNQAIRSRSAPASTGVQQVQLTKPAVSSNDTKLENKPRYGIPFELDIQGLSQIN